MTELKTRRSKSDRRTPKKTYLIEELEATSRQTIDPRKIVDFAGEAIVMTIEQEDWRGAVIGSATRCSGARAIVHNVPGCDYAAVGDQFGYMLMTDGRCIRFTHGGVVNTAQDTGQCPIGKTFKLRPVPRTQWLGQRRPVRNNNPPVPTPLRGKYGKHMVVLSAEKCDDAAVVPKAAAPAAPRSVSSGRSNKPEEGVAAAPTTDTPQGLPKQPKPRTFGLATQMRMATAHEAFEKYSRRRSQKRRRTGTTTGRPSHVVH